MTHINELVPDTKLHTITLARIVDEMNDAETRGTHVCIENVVHYNDVRLSRRLNLHSRTCGMLEHGNDSIYIILNANDSYLRQRFTLAYLLAFSILYPNKDRVLRSGPTQIRSRDYHAILLAANMLMPIGLVEKLMCRNDYNMAIVAEKLCVREAVLHAFISPFVPNRKGLRFGDVQSVC